MEITRQVTQPVILEQANQEPVNHHQAGLEAGDVQLKKQTGQAKRLGNEGLKNHPQLNNVKGALQTLQPDQLLKLLNSTIKTINGNTAKTNLDKQDIPQLTPPVKREAMAKSAGETKLSASAWAAALLGKVVQLTTDASLSKTISQLQSINAMMGGAVSAYSVMAEVLEVMGVQWAADSDALKEAQKQADVLAETVAKAQAALDNAKKNLSSLEAEAAKENPVSSELQGKLDAAKSAVTTEQAKVTLITKNQQDFTNFALNPAIDAEKKSRTALEASQAQSQKMVQSFTAQQNAVIEQQRKKEDPNAKSLMFLMALMSQLINKSSNDDLQATAELKQKLAEASAKDAEKKAKDYEEQVRKSEEMQKTMGCIGKVLGWLVTAISFVAAAFTGGASLALAAVGLALAIGDEISQAVTGRSFMADAMQPLMDAIVKPLMEMLGKIFSDIVKAFGADNETANMVGQILGAVAAAAVLVAGVMVAGSVLNKVFGVVMKKFGTEVAEEVSKSVAKNVAVEIEEEVVKDVANSVLRTTTKEVAEEVAEEASKSMAKNVAVEIEKEVVKDVANNVLRTTTKEVVEEVAEEVAEQAAKSTMQRLMDSAVGQVLKRLGNGIGRSIGADELQMAKVSNYSQKAVVGLSFVNTTSQAAVGIVSANMMLEAAKNRADMIKDAALQDVLNEMMTRAIDNFSSRMESVNEIIKNISTVANNQAQAGRYITKQMGSVAG